MNQRKQNLIMWGIPIGVAILAIGGLVSLTHTKGKTGTPSGTIPAVSSQDHVRGDLAQAKVTLTEYGDFECPACGQYYSVLKEIEQSSGPDLAVVWRHFPLPQHTNARPAAQAAEAAGLQGKFWEMHDMIFEHQLEWSNAGDAKPIFEQYARSLGLNVDQFKSDAASDAVKQKVEAGFQEGSRAGINSTPSFFLDGKKIENPSSLNAFRDLIQQSIQAAK